MSYDVDLYLEQCESELYYYEKKTNSQLDDPTANIGFNNFTKYGKFYTEYTNSSYNFVAEPWCDMWISYNAVMANVQDVVGVFAYCPSHVNWFKNRGEWVTNQKDAQRGDLIFFQSGGVACHVGVVYKVENNTIYTYEANTSGGSNSLEANGGMSCPKSYTIGSSYILGFGRPAWTTEPDTNGCPYGSSTPLLKQGSTGLGVYRFQWYATAFGEDTGGLDGQYGAKSVQACKNIQSRYGLLVDGEVGPNTWTAMIDNYQTDVKGELTVSQATEILAKLDDIQSRLVTLEATNLKVYNTLDEVKVLGNDFYVAAKYFVDNGLLKGIDASALGLSYEDCRMLVWMYRAKD